MERRKPFMQYVRKGAPNTIFDIKVMLCYLLNSFDAPISADDLFLILQSEQLINYFEYTNAMGELCDKGQVDLIVSETGEEFYQISKVGASLVVDLESALSMTLKKQVLSAAVKMFAFKQNSEENNLTVKKLDEGGYVLSIEVPGTPVPLCTMSLYFADESQVELAKNHFLENPTLVYTALLSSLTGDLTTLMTALSDEKLPMD